MSSVSRLLEARSLDLRPGTPSRRRFFELVADLQYPSPDQADLKNKKILLHCMQDNFGDVSQTYLCLEKIRKHNPAIDIQVLIERTNASEETLARIFAAHQSYTHSIARGDLRETEQIFRKFAQDRYALGVALPVSIAGVYQREHLECRTIREYGFGWHPDTNGNVLSMGVAPLEEGLCFPEITPRKLSEISSDWLKGAFTSDAKVYHLYMAHWAMQVVGLYAVVEIEKENQNDLAILLPTRYTLQNLVDWKLLDLEVLKQAGIGKIVRRTPQGVETIELGEGKCLQVVSGPIPKLEMEAIQQAAEPLFGCTGDLSFSESIALGKIPFYQIEDHKARFFDALSRLAQERGFHRLTSFWGLLRAYCETEGRIYEANKPKKHGYYDSGPSMDLAEAHSLPRICMRELIAQMKTLGQRVAAAHQDPELLQEARAFGQYLQTFANFEDRLLAIVNRGLFLQNYPELMHVEARLAEEFFSGAKNEEEVIQELRAQIQNCLRSSSPSAISTERGSGDSMDLA